MLLFGNQVNLSMEVDSHVCPKAGAAGVREDVDIKYVARTILCSEIFQ